MKLNRLNTDHVQPQNPLFTSGSQHPPRSRHAVHLGGIALSNNQFTNKWDQKLCSARFILQKHIILRLLTDLEPIVLDLEPIVQDRSRVGNQSIY